MKRKTLEQFIIQAQEKHGNKYDYSLVEYKNAKTNVIIICSKHGEFTQRPDKHLQGHGCPECGTDSRAKKLASGTSQFIEKAREIHGEIYDYSSVDYKNFVTKVKIICSKHGEFSQRPRDHLNGHDCKKCGIELGAKTRTSDIDQFIEKAIKVHGDKFNYDEIIYKNSKTKVEILCNKCQKQFPQTPGSHLQEVGCPNCGIDSRAKKLASDKEQFIEKANNIHGDKYDYSLVEYKNAQTKIIIICPKHGEFKQIPYVHLIGCGCPKCINKNETKTGEILKELFPNIEIKPQYKISKFRVDYSFEKENQKYIVEYNGKQHYEPVKFGNLTEDQAMVMFHKQIIRDEKLRKYCQENSIELIEIDGREHQGYKIKDYLEKELSEIMKPKL